VSHAASPKRSRFGAAVARCDGGAEVMADDTRRDPGAAHSLAFGNDLEQVAAFNRELGPPLDR